jgi:hypothetical protein
MLKIIAGNLYVELTTGSPYETGKVPKYFLKFPDKSVAVVYKSGIIKGVGDISSSSIGTLGGSFVTLEPDVKTGGYITLSPTRQDLDQFERTMDDLEYLKDFMTSGNRISVFRHTRLEYEPDVPADDDITDFFKKIKSRSELDAIAIELNTLLGAMDIIHPAIGDLDYLAFSLSQGCDGGCLKCNFQHNRHLRPRSEDEISSQIDFYKKLYSQQEREKFEIFAGNHRGLGIDFELFTAHITKIRNEAGMRSGKVFAFCNAEDILRLNEQYGTEEMESRMVGIGLHLNLGVESGSRAGLKEYGKNIKIEAIREALRILKSTKIPYSVNILAGVDWQDHPFETVQLFRALYRPGDNRPAVFSSKFMNEKGKVNTALEAEHYKIFRNTLNDCGIHVFRYTFIPFNKIAPKTHKAKC